MKDFAGKDLNSRNKNFDYDLRHFSSSITSENNLVPHSFTRNTIIKNVSEKQYCTLEQSRNDTKSLKISNSNENSTTEYFYTNMSCNDNTNLLLQKNQNDLIQEQYVNSKDNSFLKSNFF